MATVAANTYVLFILSLLLPIWFQNSALIPKGIGLNERGWEECTTFLLGNGHYLLDNPSVLRHLINPLGLDVAISTISSSFHTLLLKATSSETFIVLSE